ncbi:protein interacting with Hsp90 1 [Diutina catenulata]
MAMITLDPKPGFVIKTRVVASRSATELSRKVFVNVCSDSQVPKPDDEEFIGEKIFPAIVDNAWEIPIVVSKRKEDLDKKGVPSFVFDCCINTRCFTWVQLHEDLKKILIEWCLEAIEVVNEVSLDRDYSLPKMMAKGDLTHTEIDADELAKGAQQKLAELQQNEAQALLEEVRPERIDSAEELPQLFPQQSQSPVIEEVIRQDTAPPSHSSDQAENGADDMDVDADEPQAAQFVYQLRYTPLENQPYNLLVKLTSEQFTPDNVAVSLQGKDLVITPRDHHYFSKSNRELVVPLQSPKASEPRCFLVTPEHTLYVFI